jgi:hypothetical protein
MKRPTALAIGILAALVVAAPASAGPPYTGTTELLNAPVSGTTLWVDASVASATPVVAYEYALQNVCSFPHRSGSSYQRDDIVTWTYQQDGIPHVTLPVDLGAVPAGSACKVYLVRNNTVVKGSTTAYAVG